MTLRLLVVLSFAGFALVGCDKGLTDYVGGGVRDKPVPRAGADGRGVKVSGGSVRSQSSRISMKATVGPTNLQLQSTRLSAQVGMSRSPSVQTR